MGVATLVQQINHPTYPGRLSVRAQTGLLEGSGTQSYKAGAVVVASGGTVVTATSGAGVTGVLGIADKKAAGVTGAEAIILPAAGLEFEATIEDQSVGDLPLAQAHLFAQFGLYVTSGGLWYINFNDTSNKSVTVVELVDKVGTIQGRVRAKFIGSVTVFA